MAQNTGNGILEEFRIDFLDFWERLPNKALFLSLLAAWLLLFQFLGNGTFGYITSPSLLVWMYSAYSATNYEDTHGLFVPFVVLALFWWKRKELLAQPLRAWWPGLCLVALGLGLHLLGFAVQQPKLSIIGLFGGVYGLMGLAWGPALLRHSFFPFWLFAFSVPLGSQGSMITVPLQLIVCKLVAFMCHNMLAIDVVQQGALLFEPSGRYQYEVAAACSGIKSLVSIFFVATVYGFVTFGALWKRALLMISALPLSICGNLVRMLMIIVAAEFWGQDAGKAVHDSPIYSFVPYVPAILGLFGLGWLLEKTEPPRRTNPPAKPMPDVPSPQPNAPI